MATPEGGWAFICSYEGDDNDVYLRTEAQLSRDLDLADLDQAPDQIHVWKGGRFQQVKVANRVQRQPNYDDPRDINIGYADLMAEDGAVLGTVRYTDH